MCWPRLWSHPENSYRAQRDLSLLCPEPSGRPPYPTAALGPTPCRGCLPICPDALPGALGPALPCGLHPCPSRAQKPTLRCGSYSCSQKGLLRPSLLRTFPGGRVRGKSGSPVTFLTLLAGKAEGASGKACPVSASRRGTRAPTLAPYIPPHRAVTGRLRGNQPCPSASASDAGCCQGRGVFSRSTRWGVFHSHPAVWGGAEVASSPKNSRAAQWPSACCGSSCSPSSLESNTHPETFAAPKRTVPRTALRIQPPARPHPALPRCAS